MRNQIFPLLVSVVVFLPNLGCGDSDNDADDDNQQASSATVPYICLETNEVFHLDPQPETPARNPKTGKSSLVPAYQDEESKEWKPIDLSGRTTR